MDSGGLSFNTLKSNSRMHNYNESITPADSTIWINNDKYLRKLKE